MRGAFITIEGIEGVGKSSCVQCIESALTARRHTVRLTREPGGTALGEQLRDYILHGDHEALSAEVEALLMFAARAHHLGTVIEPALERGEWVVCDRFTDATFAYQGGGRGLETSFLECLREGVQHGLEPDLTLLLDAPVEVGRARIRDRKPDHFEREDTEFFERVRSTYLRLAAEHPRRITVIDAAQPKEKVERDIIEALDRFHSEFTAR